MLIGTLSREIDSWTDDTWEMMCRGGFEYTLLAIGGEYFIWEHKSGILVWLLYFHRFCEMLK